MKIKKIGIILNGVTGRMGTNQHLERSILAIMNEGGIKVGTDTVLMPDPILTGRNENKLKSLAQKYGVENYSTDLDKALANERYQIFFDSSGTQYRKLFVEKAVKAKKAIYCEKPTAVSSDEALYLHQICKDAGLKNGVVQDKLWLPGLRKFQMIKEQGFLGEILSVRGEFGYWVYEGLYPDQDAQRPSWNYRKEDGGGMVVDMHCHWSYVIDNLFGEIKSVSTRVATHIKERVDEAGKTYRCTADDSAYATFELTNGIICHFNSSWAVRVRRDDLLTMQVDGTKGSAVVGLRKCYVQSYAQAPRTVWNPDIDSPHDFFAGWQEIPDATSYENAFKVQWELFIRHVALGEPFAWGLIEGAKGVQLAEKSLESHKKKSWVDVEKL